MKYNTRTYAVILWIYNIIRSQCSCMLKLYNIYKCGKKKGEKKVNYGFGMIACAFCLCINLIWRYICKCARNDISWFKYGKHCFCIFIFRLFAFFSSLSLSILLLFICSMNIFVVCTNNKTINVQCS